jgi:hypothetical protein
MPKLNLLDDDYEEDLDTYEDDNLYWYYSS